jgi:hypothetical protein
MKKVIFSIAIIAITAPLALVGCTDRSADKGGSPPKANAGDSKIQASLAKLSSEDRKLAEAQKWCAIEQENRLGDMGTPVKVMVKDQPVFLCCKSCQKRALADPDKTLAAVEELKAKAAADAK